MAQGDQVDKAPSDDGSAATSSWRRIGFFVEIVSLITAFGTVASALIYNALLSAGGRSYIEFATIGDMFRDGVAFLVRTITIAVLFSPWVSVLIALLLIPTGTLRARSRWLYYAGWLTCGLWIAAAIVAGLGNYLNFSATTMQVEADISSYPWIAAILPYTTNLSVMMLWFLLSLWYLNGHKKFLGLIDLRKFRTPQLRAAASRMNQLLRAQQLWLLMMVIAALQTVMELSQKLPNPILVREEERATIPVSTSGKAAAKACANASQLSQPNPDRAHYYGRVLWLGEKSVVISCTEKASSFPLRFYNILVIEPQQFTVG